MKLQITQNIRNIIKKIPILESFFYFWHRFFFFSNSLEKKLIFGFCSLCGKNTIMLVNSLYNKKKIQHMDSLLFRETGACLICSANNRRRFVAELIKKIIVVKLIYKEIDVKIFKNLLKKINLNRYPLKNILKLISSEDFWIYEAGTFGPIYNTLKKHPKFISSEYFANPNLKSGQYVGGTRFEDLQSLSFKDNSIDLITTLDVFEHVQKPYMAFKEIYRVLKSDGIHIFTVPLGNIKKTFSYFDDQGKPYHKLCYHDDPLRGEGALVYTQFGTDIIEILNNLNFTSFIIQPEINSKLGIFSKVKVIVSIKTS